MWRTFLEDVELEDRALVFGLGDYLDFTRTTYRLPLAATFGEDDKAFEEYDTMVMETFVYPFVDTVRKHCPSFAKKCVGLVEGNHHARMLSHQFQNSHTSTEEICRLLGVPYLGLSAWIRVTCLVSRGKHRWGSAHNLNIVLNHSVSSSATLPASLASAQRSMLGLRGVDIFLTANDHQLGHDLRQLLGCTQQGTPQMVQHEMVIAKVGSFQRGYTEDAESTSYVEKKFLKPSRLGYLAFDAWVKFPGNHRRSAPLRPPEVWRFRNFNV